MLAVCGCCYFNVCTMLTSHGNIGSFSHIVQPVGLLAGWRAIHTRIECRILYLYVYGNITLRYSFVARDGSLAPYSTLCSRSISIATPILYAEPHKNKKEQSDTTKIKIGVEKKDWNNKWPHWTSTTMVQLLLEEIFTMCRVCASLNALHRWIAPTQNWLQTWIGHNYCRLGRQRMRRQENNC